MEQPSLKDIEEVKHLCNLAGKMMLSEELEIGLLILHSYDYFDLFYLNDSSK